MYEPARLWETWVHPPQKPPREVMPQFLNQEVLSGVPLWQVVAGVVAIVVILNVWTRISRANMVK